MVAKEVLRSAGLLCVGGGEGTALREGGGGGGEVLPSRSSERMLDWRTLRCGSSYCKGGVDGPEDRDVRTEENDNASSTTCLLTLLDAFRSGDMGIGMSSSCSRTGSVLGTVEGRDETGVRLSTRNQG